MKSTFFTFLSLFLLFACKKEIKTTSEDWQIVSENVQFKEDGNTFHLKSGKFDYTIPTSKLLMLKENPTF